MFAGFSPNKSKALVVEATQARVLRQNLIASNIANIDTPFYRAKDVDFQTALVSKKKEISFFFSMFLLVIIIELSFHLHQF